MFLNHLHCNCHVFCFKLIIHMAIFWFIMFYCSCKYIDAKLCDSAQLCMLVIVQRCQQDIFKEEYEWLVKGIFECLQPKINDKLC